MDLAKWDELTIYVDSFEFYLHYVQFALFMNS